VRQRDNRAPAMWPDRPNNLKNKSKSVTFSAELPAGKAGDY